MILAEKRFPRRTLLRKRISITEPLVAAYVCHSAQLLAPGPDLTGIDQHLALGDRVLGVPRLPHVSLDNQIVVHEENLLQVLELRHVRDVEAQVVERVHVHRVVVPRIGVGRVFVSPGPVEVSAALVNDRGVVLWPLPHRGHALPDQVLLNLLQLQTMHMDLFRVAGGDLHRSHVVRDNPHVDVLRMTGVNLHALQGSDEPIRAIGEDTRVDAPVRIHGFQRRSSPRQRRFHDGVLACVCGGGEQQQEGHRAATLA
mmetsp:Transcript_330/g.931  ORF Transcript_330/g.931 Transcript_330/m.931 type:complete len:256 (-) Transcript_330:70-837(-)